MLLSDKDLISAIEVNYSEFLRPFKPHGQIILLKGRVSIHKLSLLAHAQHPEALILL